MTEEKQIEEMGKLCPFYEEGKCNLLEDEATECNFDCDMCDFATNLYNVNYRKQSDKDSSKGCEYCKGRAYTKKPLTVITKYGRRIELVFEFCPNCGRKMKGEQQ